MSKARIYSSREAAQNSKPFVAQAMGVTKADLVIVRSGNGFHIRTRESLERYLATKA